ncbi:DUF2243 domain-containing protein [Methylocystis echinoides]|uniref:DUF2243 domain-containing protein n=1 Tax=Methylocystis echinoides TaxID=29468 RepID=UPI00343E3CB4
MNGRDNGVTAAGVVLGVGLGGFVDGIVLHQLLQWHHMLSNWSLPRTLENMELNTLWDGLFHLFTLACVAAGLVMLWRAARRPHFEWSGSRFAGALLMGWGGFNIVEGLINHVWLGVHHVNEQVPSWQWAYWDWGFIVASAAIFLIGLALNARASRGLARGAA